MSAIIIVNRRFIVGFLIGCQVRFETYRKINTPIFTSPRHRLFTRLRKRPADDRLPEINVTRTHPRDANTRPGSRETTWWAAWSPRPLNSWCALINNVFSVYNFVPGYPAGTRRKVAPSIVPRYPPTWRRHHGGPAYVKSRGIITSSLLNQECTKQGRNSRPAIPLLIQLVLDAY